jgi:two-component system, response regulator RpfG
MDIVILDDERTTTVLLEQYVRALNCVPLVFAYARDALAHCAEHCPGLVVLDYRMPEIDGIEFTQRFRALPGTLTTPVLMVSASIDPELCENAFNSGVNSFLSKPVDRRRFSALVHNVLRAPRQASQLNDRKVSAARGPSRART